MRYFHNLKRRKFCSKSLLGVFHKLHLQLWTFAYIQLLNKPYENEVTLTGQNPPLKYCQQLEIQYTVRKKSRSFNAKNFRSTGQRTAKLLDVKVGVLKKSLPSGPCPSQTIRPGCESFSKFEGQSFCSPLTYRPQIFSIERSKPF